MVRSSYLSSEQLRHNCTPQLWSTWLEEGVPGPSAKGFSALKRRHKSGAFLLLLLDTAKPELGGRSVGRLTVYKIIPIHSHIRD